MSLATPIITRMSHFQDHHLQRPFPNYDDAILSKFCKGTTSESKRRTSFLRNDSVNQRVEDDCRYFKLVMTENAFKGWNININDNGYFTHLDSPKTTLKVYSVDNISFDYQKGRNPQTFKKSYNPPPPPTVVSTPSSPSMVSSLGLVNRSPSMSPPQGKKRPREIEEDEDEMIYKAPRTENNFSYDTEDYQPDEYVQDRSDVYFSIVKSPLKHQVKEFNILPAGVLQLMKHYQASSTPADYIIVKLVCDAKMERSDIFLTAVSSHYSQGPHGEIIIPSLKVSQKMLPGRTKGYSFRLSYELQVGGKCVQRDESHDFFIWSNVNQKGYPRKERDAFINQRIEENKRKMKPKKHSPGRPKKQDTDDVSLEDS